LLKQIYVDLKPFLRVFLNTDFSGFPEYQLEVEHQLTEEEEIFTSDSPSATDGCKDD